MKKFLFQPGIAVSFMLFATIAMAAEVNLYSARKEELIKPLLDKFTEKTGIKVNLVTGKADALLTRLENEGVNSPADLFITTDAGRLHRAKSAGVLQTVQSNVLNTAVPASYRDSDGQWYGLSLRARVIMYSPERVKPETLSTYEALSDEVWRKRICIRSSNNIYNQSLVASLIEANGEEQTETWAKSLVTNMARPPAGGDRDQIKGVAIGQCDIAIANTYYLGGMLNSSDEVQQQSAQKVAVFWPNQGEEGRGTHVNVSGAGVTSASKNKDNAIKLLEYLVSNEAQQWYAEKNHEYPVKENVPISTTLKNWGEFKADMLALDKLGELNPAAVKLMDRSGWR